MKKKLRENLALLLFVLLVFCFAQAVNSSSTQLTAACSTVSCSLPGCGFDLSLSVENAGASTIQRLNH